MLAAIEICQPYLPTQTTNTNLSVRSEQLEQYRIVGFAEGKLTTFIVEYRVDEVGDYIWVVTAWKATKQEHKSYEERIY